MGLLLLHHLNVLPGRTTALAAGTTKTSPTPGFGSTGGAECTAGTLQASGLHSPRLERRVGLGDRVGDFREVAEEEVLHPLRVGHAVVPHLGVHLPAVFANLKSSTGRQSSFFQALAEGATWGYDRPNKKYGVRGQRDARAEASSARDAYPPLPISPPPPLSTPPHA